MCCRSECQFQYWEGRLSHRNGFWDMWEGRCLVVSVGRLVGVGFEVGFEFGGDSSFLKAVLRDRVTADKRNN